MIDFMTCRSCKNVLECIISFESICPFGLCWVILILREGFPGIWSSIISEFVWEGISKKDCHWTSGLSKEIWQSANVGKQMPNLIFSLSLFLSCSLLLLHRNLDTIFPLLFGRQRYRSWGLCLHLLFMWAITFSVLIIAVWKHTTHYSGSLGYRNHTVWIFTIRSQVEHFFS